MKKNNLLIKRNIAFILVLLSIAANYFVNPYDSEFGRILSLIMPIIIAASSLLFYHYFNKTKKK